MTEPTERENRQYEITQRYRNFIGSYLENRDNIVHYREQPNRVPLFYYNMFCNIISAEDQSYFPVYRAEQEFHYLLIEL